MLRTFRSRLVSRQQPSPRFRRRSFRHLGGEALEERRLLTITVDTLVDEADGSIVDGDVSLRDAIALAPSGETIDFAPQLSGGTIELTLGELLIERDLAIDGPGAADLTIDAGHGDDNVPATFDGSRIFNIDDGDSAHDLAVSISGLTLTGGDVVGEGGAIRTTEGLFLADVIVDDNAAESDGGGVYATSAFFGTTTITDSTISGNITGNNGGGVYVVTSIGGATDIADTTISDNTSIDLGQSSRGGGIYIRTEGNGVSNITHSTITGNSATSTVSGSRGAGIVAYSSGGVTTIGESTISANYLGTRRTLSAAGAGIYFRAATHTDNEVTISGVAVFGNSSSMYGNAVGVAMIMGRGTAHIDSSMIYDNSGDGVQVSTGMDGTVTISRSTIAGNGRNGLLVTPNLGAVTVTQSTISGNDREGVSVVIRDGTTKITDSTITDNSWSGLIGGPQGSEYNGTVEVGSTIIAGNASSDVDVGPVDSGILVSSGYNLIGFGISTVDFSGPGDQTGVADPLLGPLAHDGGPTMTHAPLPGSPAIDAGDPAFTSPPDYDQHGAPFDRVVAGRIDIGAVEYAPAPLPGDGNLDGSVDKLDYLIWADHFRDDPAQDPPGSPMNGDYNDDGIVDALDYLLWAANYGATSSGGHQDGAVSSVSQHAQTAPSDNVDDLTSVAIGIRASAEHINDDSITAAVDSIFESLTTKKHHSRWRR